MAQKINKTALANIMANREAILSLAKGMNMEQMKTFDSLLDEMVFGESLGLMGEKMQNAPQNPLEVLRIEDVDDQTCEVVNA